jgi:hypothetical protein
VSTNPPAGPPTPDFPLCGRTSGRGRSFTTGEIELLGWLTLLGPAPDRPDDVFEPGRPGILDSHLVLSVAVSLAAANPLYRHLEAAGFTIVAALSHDATLREPLRGGDTLIVDSEVVTARRSRSREREFVVGLHDICRNQDDCVVAVIDRTVLFRYEPATGAVGPEG